MSGHSKFANIRHRKDAQDAKRAKVFVKIVKEITVAVQKGGADLDSNSALRLCLEKARAANMPKDNFERAVKKASGANDTSNYEEIRYEGYGPNGVAIIVDCLTDNRNRTAANVRSCFTKKGGALGQPNSVAYMFERKGLIVFTDDNLQEETVLEWLMETPAENLEVEGSTFVITTLPENLMRVRNFLSEHNIKNFDACELSMQPNQTVTLDAEHQEKLENLISALEDDDDVQQVYHNAELN